MISDNESIANDSASEFEYEEHSDVEIKSEGGEANGNNDDQMVIEPPEVRKAPYVIMNRAE
eukprot:CAMPEP_0185911532 /NCGR_PEP_ID=MMETSP0196C-20130402/30079_1 /TAXON_ID=2932 /ORGANISM="Alexandrium fundyense, Strain CCMP1719" /LENGTH=60 /DNA_ID=CAMNT_0028632597 /DNA_START=122 /DNA_END=301 /DNA_ORIENTATION=+